MITDKTTPSETVTRDDDDVGKLGSPAVAGGRQTAQQEDITNMSAKGRSDNDRQKDRDGLQHDAGRNPVPVGGSSGGHSDQKSASGNGEKVAHGHYKVEKERD
ncbi:hypothetical protein [Methylobacterium brachythecii]|uniref:Uncharacterized protein n=1 Tax=Methylobacterium brachythecii TaxID=1176177 RepID=A0A7W6F7C7_9HYPH|nr:hypothetical protein [Methylobacterium brachythecii]MBB3903245.1 hypothetical protein [Methylobacterium brachythecii]GLS46023.1 hypothetical protein GCM10007884_40140 [Methylobacterium brachythecii]